MHALIVYAHPEPRSFNAAMKNQAVDTLESLGWIVEVSDLHEMGFDHAAGWTLRSGIQGRTVGQSGRYRLDAAGEDS